MVTFRLWRCFEREAIKSSATVRNIFESVLSRSTAGNMCMFTNSLGFHLVKPKETWSSFSHKATLHVG